MSAKAARRSKAKGAGEVPAAELGVRRHGSELRFALFAPGDRRVELLVNEGAAGGDWTRRAALDRAGGDGLRVVSLDGLPERFEYAFRVDAGPELCDPFATRLAGAERWGDRSWEGRGLRFRPYRGVHDEAAPLPTTRPERPRIAERERVIYELHVRGFTRHASSGVTHPGTYAGLAEKIPYLVDLGVTTLELLPVFEFDETENFRRNPRTGERLLNFWGYSPVSFFAPKRSYAAGDDEVAELVALVDACHEAGLEVVLDVVYNHTAEGGGGATDPTRSFRGLAEDVYYVRDAATGRPFDCTGCGNTVNTNHPVVTRMILDSLDHWANRIGVDGFRFDLASVFHRGLEGERLEISPVADAIAHDPRLAGRLLVAEPWDVTGFSPPSGFAPPWRIWNGPFRDDVRRFVRGDAVAPRTLALRLGGSRDLFPRAAGAAPRTVDFATCHDGFTLQDLVSFAGKHNEENGEEGRDGTDFNLSSNHGAEGPTEDAAIVARRDLQAFRLLALTLLSRGTPMLLAGDERARTQSGNNNAWCRDDETSWVDWAADDRGRLELVRRLIALRRELAGLDLERWATIAPFEEPSAPPPAPVESGAALLLFREAGGEAGSAGVDLALAVNGRDRAARVPLPRSRHGGWTLLYDSHREPRVDRPGERPGLAPATVELELPPRSLRLLASSRA